MMDNYGWWIMLDDNWKMILLMNDGFCSTDA